MGKKKLIKKFSRKPGLYLSNQRIHEKYYYNFLEVPFKAQIPFLLDNAPAHLRPIFCSKRDRIVDSPNELCAI